MAVTATVTNKWTDAKRIHVLGSLSISGSYVTGGDTITFSNPSLIKSKSPVLFMEINGQSKYLYRAVIGTPTKMKVYVPETGAELSAAAYPTGVTGDVVTFYAIYRKFV